MELEMGKIIKYQNIINHLIGIALFLLTAILMMWLSSPNGPIYNSKTKGLDAQKLKIQSEIMQFSDQYQIILKGEGFRAGIAGMAFEIKGKNNEPIEMQDIRARVVDLGFSDKYLCRGTEGIGLDSDYYTDEGMYQKVFLQWRNPAEKCKKH